MNHKSEMTPTQNVNRIKVLYARCSHIDQNIDRQMMEKDKYDIVIEEYASGRIPFGEREGGKKIMEMVDKAKRDPSWKMELHLHSLERLGRRTDDLLNTVRICTEAGVGIVCESQGIRTLLPDGTKSITNELLLNLLSILANYELEVLASRRREGIAAAKAKGTKYLGRKPNSKETVEKFLSKPKVVKALEYLRRGLTCRDASRLSSIHTNTCSKIKRLAKIR